jgi:hypothetical protein
MPKNKVSEYSATAATLTQEYLKSILDYNLDTGIFTWKVSKANRTKVGDVAGWSYNGYREIEINNKAYKAHRLAWLYVYGEMPKNLVDHIDGNRSNNKISNLREATYQENSENYKTPKTNKSGVKNVSWYKSLNKWVVSISIRKTKKTVGYYDDLELAELVAIEARNKYRGEFANHG